MSALNALVKRDTKLFFKDKGMFFTSLITPLLLLVLYGTFLGNVYRDIFQSALDAAGASAPERLIGGCVGGELVSSLLAVCCVTVAFCSNMLMVQDKVSGARRDLTISPVKSGTLALGYYISTLLSTLLVCYVTTGVCLLYIAKVGWYLTAADVLLLLLDVLLLVLFGTALSSIVTSFLSSQGQMSAVGTIISAGYGFICGAYMPISSFSAGLQRVISFLPGTYGTSLVRNHTMRGALAEMQTQGVPVEVINELKSALDLNLELLGQQVSISSMYLILIATIVILITVFILLNRYRKTK